MSFQRDLPSLGAERFGRGVSASASTRRPSLGLPLVRNEARIVEPGKFRRNQTAADLKELGQIQGKHNLPYRNQNGDPSPRGPREYSAVMLFVADFSGRGAITNPSQMNPISSQESSCRRTRSVFFKNRDW